MVTRESASRIEFEFERQAHDALGEIEIMRERAADDLGLFVDFLGHEMAVVALVDQEASRPAAAGSAARRAARWRRGSARLSRVSVTQSPSSR